MSHNQATQNISNTKSKTKNDFDARLLAYLEENYYNADLQVQNICKAMLLSRTHLHRKTKEYFGKSIIDVVIEFRMDKAREILSTTTKLKDVAAQVGFKDAKYFVRVFKKKTGIHPKEFIV
jgi:two-component system, response regulator YesN